jgi:hypothetical protein
MPAKALALAKTLAGHENATAGMIRRQSSPNAHLIVCCLSKGNNEEKAS